MAPNSLNLAYINSLRNSSLAQALCRLDVYYFKAISPIKSNHTNFKNVFKSAWFILTNKQLIFPKHLLVSGKWFEFSSTSSFLLIKVFSILAVLLSNITFPYCLYYFIENVMVLVSLVGSNTHSCFWKRVSYIRHHISPSTSY